MPSLLVASSGGHLAQLELLSRRMQLPQPITWVTFDTPQSRSLLKNKNIRYSPFAGTRDIRGTWNAFGFAREMLKEQSFDVVVSTGASLALAFLPLAARKGASVYYIESATRIDGPSLTGRILQLDKRINLRAQYEHLVNSKWKYGGCIFDGFIPSEVDEREVKKIVVTVGMHKDFGFPRLVKRLHDIIPFDVDVVWQTGVTDVTQLGITGIEHMTAEMLNDEIAQADVVITHAGMGSAISCLEAAKRAIFVPRRAQYHEHVDDHQVSIASHLHNRQLVSMVEADELTWDDVKSATRWTIDRSESRPFNLDLDLGK